MVHQNNGIKQHCVHLIIQVVKGELINCGAVEDKPTQKGELPNVTKLPAYFILSGSEFHTVGPAEEKYLDPIYIFSL